jgi:hypothetical protein
MAHNNQPHIVDITNNQISYYIRNWSEPQDLTSPHFNPKEWANEARKITWENFTPPIDP